MRKHPVPAIALLLFCSSLVAQAAVFNGGRCDGAVTLYMGDTMRFYPGVDLEPRFLWILVQEGGGNAMIQDSAGNITSTLYLNTFDMLLFDARSWIDLYFQGGACKIYYGGANVNPPAHPVCNTGSLGPVLILTDELRNVGVQSGAAGPPRILSSVYLRADSLTNGSLSYRKLSNLEQWGLARSTACSGSTCCNPQDSTFFVRNVTGAGFTGFLLDSENMASFDWTMVPAPPIVCGATAEPTSGTVPVTVSFHAVATGGSGEFRYAWNFGDGKSDNGESVTHTYKAGGTFTWKLTVTDQADKTCTKTGTLTFLSPLSLTAAAMPRQGEAPLTVTFSCAPKGGRTPYTYEWLFGDGERSTEQAPTHTYAQVGKYQALITVTDADGTGAAMTVPVYCGVPIDPTISAVQKLTNPFRLAIVGADFEPGCTAFVDGAPVPVTAYKKSTKVVAKGSTLKAMLPKGQPRCITVRNPSTGTSACFWYTR